MKRNAFIVFCLAITLSLPVAAADLKVTRISVTGTETTDPAVVREAFVEVAVGDTLPEARLEEVVALVHDRLVSLGYFGSVDVTLVRSKARSDTAALVAEVTEGFTGRYGGGPVYARVGQANLGGRGIDGELDLGWNRQSAALGGPFLGSRGLGWFLEGGNRPEARVDGRGRTTEDHLVGTQAALDKDWGWGWTTALGVKADLRTDPGYRNGTTEGGPWGRVGWRRAALGYSPSRGASASGEVSALWPLDRVETRADLRVYWPLTGGLKVALRTAGSWLNRPQPDRPLVLSGPDGVRKAFDTSDLAQQTLWASAELRWAWTPWDLGFTTVTVEPALVADRGWTDTGTGAPAPWAWGGALRVFVGAPVFLPVRLEVTRDQGGRYRVGFSTTEPF